MHWDAGNTPKRELQQYAQIFMSHIIKTYKALRGIPFLSFLLAALCLNGQGADKPVNLLFILVDDQRNDTLGCTGHPVIQTPNIDRLAAQGIRFENAFVNSSICMASRATIFTGLTETSHGFTSTGAPPNNLVQDCTDELTANYTRQEIEEVRKRQLEANRE